MTRRAAIGLRAEKDVSKAFEWYENQRTGLGDRFVTAFRETVEALERTPELGHVVHEDVRRISVQDFPYGIYYRISASGIKVRACLHDRRGARVREPDPVEAPWRARKAS